MAEALTALAEDAPTVEGLLALPLRTGAMSMSVLALLALLPLGVKNIRPGAKLPAFVTPAVLKVLVETYNIMPIGTVEDDLKAMGLAAQAGPGARKTFPGNEPGRLLAEAPRPFFRG